MKVPLRELLGLDRVPNHRTTASEWLCRKGISSTNRNGNGGKIETVDLNDLPVSVRTAYIARLASDAGLDMGEYDDQAHVALLEAPAKQQDRATENVAKLLFVVKQERLGMKFVQIERAGKKAFGTFATRNTIKSWKALTNGVAPANWAPVLAPKWTGSGTGDPISAEAFAQLINLVKLGGNNGTGYPLKHAYKMVANEAEAKGWDWPKLHTVRRCWNAMNPIERLISELGEERAKSLLTLRMPQHTRGLAAMDIADFDGREFKVRVEWPDGTVSCPWVVAFVDRASRKTVGYAVGKSENSDVTEAAIVNMCETNYRPIQVACDNGGAFNSHRIMGAQSPLFRKKQTSTPDWDAPGVLTILDIAATNKGVGAKTSNLQENVWSHLRHVDNHPAFHRAQRSGPNDPENKTPRAVPVQVFEQVLDDAIQDLNAETRNRVKGLLRGESRDQAFERLLGDAAKRVITPFMRRRLGMIWKIKTVQQNGRIHFDGGLIGDHTTQTDMLYHRGKQVLVGFNPKNFHEPAMVFHWADKAKRGRLFLESLLAVAETQHGSAEGMRNASAEKRRQNALIKKHKVTNPDADVAAIRKTLADKERSDQVRDPNDAQVVEIPRGNGFSITGHYEGEGTVSKLNPERMKKYVEATKRMQEAKA